MKNRSALKVIVVIFSDKLSLGIKEKRVSESKRPFLTVVRRWMKGI